MFNHELVPQAVVDQMIEEYAAKYLLNCTTIIGKKYLDEANANDWDEKAQAERDRSYESALVYNKYYEEVLLALKNYKDVKKD